MEADSDEKYFWHKNNNTIHYDFKLNEQGEK
jgi:hypothetical protein